MKTHSVAWKCWAVGTIALTACVLAAATYQAFTESVLRYSLVFAICAAVLSLPPRWRGIGLHDVSLVFSGLMASTVIFCSALYDLFNPYSTAAAIEGSGVIMFFGIYLMLADYIHRIFAFEAYPGLEKDIG